MPGATISQSTKSENVIFAFLHFSNTSVFEKWWDIPVPQKFLIKSEIS